MKKIIILSEMLTSSLIFSQVGINTSNPQGTFHVDGAKDNVSTGVPTIAQQANDFVVLSNGNVGAGTVNPTNKLDIRSTTSGALKIVDGTQGNAKVLTSDANGVATWRTLPASTDTNIYNSNGTLTGARTVTQGTNTLAFTSTATTGANHFSVDGNTFSVDAANNRVGIGTAAPTNVLDVRSATSGALKIADGTQGDKKILTSDANGVATWQRAASNVAVGTLGIGYDIPFSQFSDYRYTGSSITLPPGKWMVTISLLIYPSGNFTINDWMFIRSTFSEANLTTIGQSGTQSSDVIRPTLMSFQLIGPFNGGQKYNVATGTVQIDNTSGTTKTYRYIVGNTQASGTVSGAGLLKVGGSWSENAIYAVAVN